MILVKHFDSVKICHCCSCSEFALIYLNQYSISSTQAARRAAWRVA